eukprot:jgi/Chlat1/8108/Chrsp75S07557
MEAPWLEQAANGAAGGRSPAQGWRRGGSSSASRRLVLPSSSSSSSPSSSLSSSPTSHASPCIHFTADGCKALSFKQAAAECDHSLSQSRHCSDDSSSDGGVELPGSVLRNIFARLDAASLAKASCTCVFWRDVAYDDLLWEQHCLQRWPAANKVLQKLGAASYRQLFERLAQAGPARHVRGEDDASTKIQDLSFFVNYYCCGRPLVSELLSEGRRLGRRYVHDEFNLRVPFGRCVTCVPSHQTPNRKHMARATWHVIKHSTGKTACILDASSELYSDALDVDDGQVRLFMKRLPSIWRIIRVYACVDWQLTAAGCCDHMQLSLRFSHGYVSCQAFCKLVDELPFIWT